MIRRRRFPPDPPHPGLTVALMLGALLAWWPGVVPRAPLIAAAVTAVTVSVTCVLGRLIIGSPRHPRPADRWLLVGAAVTLGAAAALNLLWQNMIRADLGVAGVGAGYWVGLVVSAAFPFAAIAQLRWPAGRSVLTLPAVLVAQLLVPGTAEATEPPRSGMASGVASYDTAAEAVVGTWRRDGGPARAAVVVAVPTGSGWVDAAAIDAVTARFAGDVAILSLPYDTSSSWQTFVTDPEAAGHSAVALLREVIGALDDAAAAEPRPRIYLYGQSLGALGADRAREWADRHHPGVLAGTLLAGVPADSVATTISGSARTVLANPSDPVTRWSTAAIWRPPEMPSDTRLVGADSRQPPWLPVVSFVATSVDLLGALDGPVGTGHRYGPEQAEFPDQPIGPRAASKAAPTR